MASKRHVRRAKCGDKIQMTYEQAKLAVDQMWRIHHQDFQAYKCKWCGRFHIGHSKDKED